MNATDRKAIKLAHRQRHIEQLQTLEDGDGNIPTDSQIEAWRKGEQTLYACYYVGFVEELTPVDLTTIGELVNA